MGAPFDRQAIHPAIARFLAWDDSGYRLLFIRAAAGTGRDTFARSWIGNRSGELLDFSGGGIDVAAETDRLVDRLRADKALHLAVILPPGASIWELASRAPCRVANHRDLLLDAGETEQLIGAGARVGQLDAHRIHELSGGWLAASRVLAADPQAQSRAQQIIRNGLAVWLANRDPDGELSEAAFLPAFDRRTVEAFYGEFSLVVHTLEELVEAGLVQSDGRGGWMMPLMVRKVLAERVGLRGRERIAVLEQAAVNAMAATRGVGEAVDSAVARRSWPALLNLLLERWVDIFIGNPRQLGVIAAKIPRFISEQTEYMRVGLRILGQSDRDGMAQQLPGFEPDYDTNQTAQRLHRDTLRLYRKPNAHALTVGILEMLHLRLAGLYEEAAVAGTRLRDALHRALDTQRVNPALVSLIELQIGISLQLAGRDVQARAAYERGFHWAQVSGKAFLLADLAGKLALLDVLEGGSDTALRWLAEHDAAIGDVGWGRKMVERTAMMARAFLALARLDYAGFDEVMETLPPMVDNDEFWSVHAQLLALQKLNAGIFDAARTLISSLRRDRRFAAAAPLARRLFDDTLLLAEILERGGVRSGTGIENRDPLLVALGHLLGGNPDAALAALQEVPPAGGMRWRGNLALYLDIAARNPLGPTPAALLRVKQQHRDSGVLYELAILGMVPGWSEVGRSLDLEPDELQRLGYALDLAPAPLPRRPVLTVREQEILRQLRAGMTRRQIAEAGYRSENTVKTQMRSLYRKLEASDVEQALENARAWGL
ncbi:helix-turn-helix transcriptional regulator [Paeniglutamicibacter sp. ABSL32-1]|uniref:helix-turn-helix transcriptional regulator n=1 Tax=Paeniglutamicibacter quisquiliarum TaxID=2849498 RepID=UPI001C2D4AB5|nr:helix-turn-helix transcriptional regulator [Paeniglutamicibacter quisquiliarum]MBV1777521.1 helix-turn-helix transcriptional regulator [Paeniglutamicibacter quisquiliarum]